MRALTQEELIADFDGELAVLMEDYILLGLQPEAMIDLLEKIVEEMQRIEEFDEEVE